MNTKIVTDTESGGTHTSRTLMTDDLRKLLSACSATARPSEYRTAILDHNVLGKATESSRQKSLRYLKELYILDGAVLLFRALRDLWDKDVDAQPLICLTCGIARDPLLRATADAVLPVPEGTLVTPEDLAEAVKKKYPESYSEAIAAKIGRNTASSWTQSGHLVGRTKKVRSRVERRPAAVAYALFIGHLEGLGGRNLLSSMWVRALDADLRLIADQAFAAAQRGWIEFRQAGGLTEVGFRWLRRREEGAA